MNQASTTVSDAPGVATHALHVKQVPYNVWCLARHNANLSRMTFREYVIRLLADARPYPPSTTTEEGVAHAATPNPSLPPG